MRPPHPLAAHPAAVPARPGAHVRSGAVDGTAGPSACGVRSALGTRRRTAAGGPPDGGGWDRGPPCRSGAPAGQGPERDVRGSAAEGLTASPLGGGAASAGPCARGRPGSGRDFSEGARQGSAGRRAASAARRPFPG
ncbi:hypothetical protein GCM10027440_39920 [Nocardiopsis coralliicola]